MTTKQKKANNKVVKKQPAPAVGEEKNEKDIKIRNKNYLILGGIFLATFAIVFLLRHWYISYRDYQLTIPVLKDTLREITVAELDHYITATPDAIIYIEVSDDENSRNVAEGLKDVIKERNLANKLVYLNLSTTKDKEKFFKEFSDKYMGDKKLNHYPALVLFLDGKVDAYVSKTSRQSLNIGDIAQIFDQYELEGDN